MNLNSDIVLCFAADMSSEELAQNYLDDARHLIRIIKDHSGDDLTIKSKIVRACISAYKLGKGNMDDKLLYKMQKDIEELKEAVQCPHPRLSNLESLAKALKEWHDAYEHGLTKSAYEELTLALDKVINEQRVSSPRVFF